MNMQFRLDGCYTLEITDNGHLVSPDGRSGSGSAGNVGIQLLYEPLQVGTPDRAPDAPKSLLQVFLKPSQARAIASAMLSAATEARTTR